MDISEDVTSDEVFLMAESALVTTDENESDPHVSRREAQRARRQRNREKKRIGRCDQAQAILVSEDTSEQLFDEQSKSVSDYIKKYRLLFADVDHGDLRIHLRGTIDTGCARLIIGEERIAQMVGCMKLLYNLNIRLVRRKTTFKFANGSKV